MFSLQKCEPSSSGTGAAGDPLFAEICPGESASVTVEEDGSAEVSIAPGFLGGLSSVTVEIRVNGELKAILSQGSVTLPGLKKGDVVTMTYTSKFGTKVTVTFTFDPDERPPVAAQMCVAVYTSQLNCGNPENPFGPVTFLGWRCKTYNLPTEEIPTPFSEGWVPPVIFSDEFQQCQVLLYVKGSDDETECSLSSCDDPDPDPSNYPPAPDAGKFDLWCPCS